MTLFDAGEPTKKQRRSKKRDAHFEAIRDTFYPSGVADTRSEHARVSEEAAMLRARTGADWHKTALMEKLRQKIAAYRRAHPKLTVTARGVLGNWDAVGEWVTAQRDSGGSDKAAEAREFDRHVRVFQAVRDSIPQSELDSEFRRLEQAHRQGKPLQFGLFEETLVNRLRPGAIARELEENAT